MSNHDVLAQKAAEKKNAGATGSMSYNETLAWSLRRIFAHDLRVEEKAMFGGVAFMLGGKMCCGILKDDLVVRVGPERYAAALEHSYVRPMDFTGRPMKGYVYVGVEGWKDHAPLKRWVLEGAEFVTTMAQSEARKTGKTKTPQTHKSRIVSPSHSPRR